MVRGLFLTRRKGAPALCVCDYNAWVLDFAAVVLGAARSKVAVAAGGHGCLPRHVVMQPLHAVHRARAVALAYSGTTAKPRPTLCLQPLQRGAQRSGETHLEYSDAGFRGGCLEHDLGIVDNQVGVSSAA